MLVITTVLHFINLTPWEDSHGLKYCEESNDLCAGMHHAYDPINALIWGVNLLLTRYPLVSFFILFCFT